jgi:glycerol uptake facilitator-like aquaporin
MLLRLQSVTAGLLYMVAQCLGAIFGALILWGCNSSLTSHCDMLDAAGLEAEASGVCAGSALPNGEGYGPAYGLGVNTVDIRVSSGCAFLIEIMGTYLLVFTVLMAAVHTKSTGGNAVPIAIGWSVLVAHLILIPYTGCGINPARSLGPMVSTY